ncbi:hypothetical protein [Leptotrichia shahii]|uniref:hypothetical protein n=1 Tax=Leptotrichia shahii TaxID=157691 RepID=UPI0028D52446|nr:hypothetical protein [Leptotrichia shahii]
MKIKVLICLLLSSILTMAQIPNVWTWDYEQGSEIFAISNKQNYILDISCNVQSFNTEGDHSVTLYKDNYDKLISSAPDIEFLIDGSAYYPLSMRSTTRKGAEIWTEFMEALSSATEIEVYKDGNIITTFKPSARSTEKISENMRQCGPFEPLTWD